MSARRNTSGLDDIGALLCRVLSYRAYCETLWKSRQAPALGSYAHYIRLLKSRARSAFQTLSGVSTKRDQWGWDTRSARYFWDIFPCQDFERGEERTYRPAPDDQPGNNIQDVKAHAACVIATELVQVKRLLKQDPRQWMEQELFAQEREHAEKVWRDKDFKSRYKSFLSEHSATIGEIQASNTSAPLRADFGYLDRCPGDDFTDAEGYLQFDLALLCAEYNLEGISCTQPYVIPQRLAFIYDAANVVMKLPRYLDVDLHRHLPLDVIKLLQVCEHPLYFKPRLPKVQRKEQWFQRLLPQQVHDTYYGLVRDGVRSPHGLTMTVIHCELHKVLRGSNANYDEATRIRQARQLLQYHGIRPAKQDPYILGLRTGVQAVSI